MRKFNDRKRWTERELLTMLKTWIETDHDLLKTAVSVGRTGGSICSKLHDIKILSFDNKNMIYHHNETKLPYKNYCEVKVVDAYMAEVDPNAPWEEFFEVAK